MYLAIIYTQTRLRLCLRQLTVPSPEVVACYITAEVITVFANVKINYANNFDTLIYLFRLEIAAKMHKYAIVWRNYNKVYFIVHF